ncbi:hypothetical protein EB052_01215 [bacterium]|nr:hypothetical protein [bacterium]
MIEPTLASTSGRERNGDEDDFVIPHFFEKALLNIPPRSDACALCSDATTAGLQEMNDALGEWMSVWPDSVRITSGEYEIVLRYLSVGDHVRYFLWTEDVEQLFRVAFRENELGEHAESAPDTSKPVASVAPTALYPVGRTVGMHARTLSKRDQFFVKKR